MPYIIKVRDLKKDYNTEKTVVHSLRGINLSIKAGETIAIVGASGAGKSTLLHILGTLEAPSSGEVIINGINPFKELEKEDSTISNKKMGIWKALRTESQLARFRNENIGFVFQFHHLLPEFSALENVMMPALINGISKAASKEMAENTLVSVGLKDRLVHKPTELSGGEQQRVAIARAIVLEPKILLSDEPTGNLDTKTGNKIHDLLLELNETKNITQVIVTHNQNFATGMQRIITVVDGKVV